MWKTFTWLRHFTKKWGWRLEKASLTPALCIEVPVSSQASERYRLSFLSTIILMDSGTVVTVWFVFDFFNYICITPRYSWTIAKVGVKQQSINQSINHAYGIRMSRTNRMRMKAYDIPLMKMISTDNNQPEKPMSMVTIFVTLPTPIIWFPHLW